MEKVNSEVTLPTDLYCYTAKLTSLCTTRSHTPTMFAAGIDVKLAAFIVGRVPVKFAAGKAVTRTRTALY